MKKKKKGLAKKIMLAVLIVYVFLMVAVYLVVAHYFSSHFLRGTTINGIDCSNMTVRQVKDSIQDKIGEYSLRVTELGGAEEVISAGQIALTYVDDNKVDQLMEEQNQWKWISSISNNSMFELAANTTYDKNLIDSVMDKMNCFQEANVTVPQDAYLQDNGTSYVIVPEVEGNQLDREKVKNLIMEAIDNGKTGIDLVEQACYLKPTVYQDNEALISERDTLNRFLQTNLTYDFGDRTEVVDASVIKDWLVKGEDGQWSVNPDSVAAYVQQLAYKYDTFGLTHIFTTTAGQQITLKGGDYGWVIKKQATSEALLQAINEGQTGTITPIYLYEGKSRATDDIGGTYVEISIEEQRMWCYKDGVLIVDTPVVTGNPNKEGCATPSGSVWAIDAKKSPAVLEGEGYKQDVTYWMPFVDNVGIHDADTWRSQYGGQIYLSSGSHGCVNTPTANAEKIYNAVEIGTPVIVY